MNDELELKNIQFSQCTDCKYNGGMILCKVFLRKPEKYMKASINEPCPARKAITAEKL